MFNPNIGLYLYRVTLNPRRKMPINFGDVSEPTVSECIDEFAQLNLEKNLGGDIGRRWFFTHVHPLEDGYSFHLDYGRAGFGSRILDGRTRKLNYDRKVSDVEVVPLLARVWLPTSGKYGIWAFQSFGQHSCNGLVLADFKNYCQTRWPELVFQPLPIVPSYLETYQSAPVTAVTLKTKATGDAASDQTIAHNGDTVNIDVRITSPRGGNLGKLRELLPRFSGKKAKGRQFGGQEYQEAYATIDIGGRTRTVSLYGASRGTGLIDLDGEVKKLAGTQIRVASFRSRMS